MTYLTNTPCAPARIASRRRGLFTTLATLLALAEQRRSLARLDTHQLDDLGLTRDAAEREAGRPIWDVPSNWRD